MLDKGVVTKDAIVQSLAVHLLAEDSYMRNPLFAPIPEEPEKPAGKGGK